MFFSLLRQRERTKRDHVARSVSDKIMIHRFLCNSVTTRHSSSKLDSALATPSFHSFAAGLASLKQVLAMPSAPCSIIGFYTFPSCYRNVIRSKDEDYSSFRPPSRNLFRVIRRRSRGKPGMRGMPAMRFYRCSPHYPLLSYFNTEAQSDRGLLYYLRVLVSLCLGLFCRRFRIKSGMSFIAAPLIIHCLRRLSSRLGID